MLLAAMGVAGTASPNPTPPTPTPPVVVVVPAPSVSVTSPVTIKVPQQQEDWPLILSTLAVALAAIAIALDWPSRLLRGADLRASIAGGPPDRHLIKTRILISASDEEYVIEERTAYYCRLRVANSPPGRFGRLEANNVEVQLIRLHVIEDKKESVDPVFLPIRLVWSHVDGPVRDRILPGLYNHVDLLRILADDDGEPWLEFLTEVSPNEFPDGEIPNVKPAGHYRLEFAVAAANASTKFYNADIHWSGVLDPHDAGVMEKELVVTVAARGS
ncbi:MAG: hypothetical protein ABI334_01885 [Candidatus Dormiibacterota bacterium]